MNTRLLERLWNQPPLESARISVGAASVTVQWRRPAAAPFPTILLLHGAAGIWPFQLAFNRLANPFLQMGYGVFLVHYFESSGTRRAGERQIRAHYPLWVDSVRATLRFMTGILGVDSQRMVLAGHSLGGFLAVTVASKEPAVRAVVELAGGIDPINGPLMKRLPATLIFHGKRDRIVPVHHAFALRDLAAKTGSPFELHVYEKDGHLFSRSSSRDAMAQTRRFLTEHVNARERIS